jgi:menaquinone-dependent protoporphyrinogen IX oxidase
MQIIYYSLQGTTEKIARELATELDLPLYQIEDVYSRQGLFNFIRSGYEATFRRCPRIKKMDGFQPAQDVILLTPIWAGQISSPLRTFCKQNAGKFRSFSLILTHLDPQNRYEAMKEEVAKIMSANCQIFESFCAKTVSSADVKALSIKLRDNY